MHDVTYFGTKSVEACTEAWLSVAKNPLVRVIGHSGSELFRYDYEAVIPVFGQNGKLVEINEHTFVARRDSVPNCKKIALVCKKHGVPIVINSDAHFSTQVGSCSNAAAMLREVDFPEELVLNASKERFDAYLKKYTRVYQSIQENG